MEQYGVFPEMPSAAPPEVGGYSQVAIGIKIQTVQERQDRFMDPLLSMHTMSRNASGPFYSGVKDFGSNSDCDVSGKNSFSSSLLCLESSSSLLHAPYTLHMTTETLTLLL